MLNLGTVLIRSVALVAELDSATSGDPWRWWRAVRGLRCTQRDGTVVLHGARMLLCGAGTWRACEGPLVACCDI